MAWYLKIDAVEIEDTLESCVLSDTHVVPPFLVIIMVISMPAAIAVDAPYDAIQYKLFVVTVLALVHVGVVESAFDVM